MGHMAKKRVAVVASGVDQPDLHAGAFETVAQMIQFHHPRTPANQPLARKVWKGLLQRTKPDQIGAIAEPGIGDKAVPMIGRRFYIDRPGTAGRLRRAIMLIKRGRRC
jgi:hypothetical protein